MSAVAPLWQQALSMRKLMPPAKRLTRAQMTPYSEDGHLLLKLIAETMQEWHVTRAELNGTGKQGAQHAWAMAARAHLFRACYRHRLRALFVGKFMGLERRTVDKYYAECRRRMGKVAA